MGWRASNPVWLKSKSIKNRLLSNIKQYSGFGHLYEIDENYIYLKFQEEKQTDLCEDNKEYYIIIPFKKSVEIYDKIIIENDRKIPFLYGAKFNAVSHLFIDSTDNMKIYRVSFHR